LESFGFAQDRFWFFEIKGPGTFIYFGKLGTGSSAGSEQARLSRSKANYEGLKNEE
jgi:hypothetical protein